MTSLAFIFGCVPLWFASGAGSVARRIMGTTVIGGMLAASAIGIFFIPAIFYLVEKLAGAKRARTWPSRPRAPRLRRRTDVRRFALLTLGLLLAGCMRRARTTTGPAIDTPGRLSRATAQTRPPHSTRRWAMRSGRKYFRIRCCSN